MIDIAIRAAREAGLYLRENVGRARAVEIKKGEERNLVSEIDRGAEARIISLIRGAYPGHDVLAEESGGAEASATYRWIIDPLDGTTNFLHGVPIFSVSIGVEHRGEIVAGVVYDPNLDELFTAERGSGAFLNGRRLAVSSIDEMIRSLLVTGFPYDIAQHPRRAVDHFRNFLTAASGIRRLGSAALDLCYVAAGRFDGYWEVHLQPWDMAAGKLLVEEAGGRTTDFVGAPAHIHGGQIVASNGRLHQAMLDILARSLT
jgi:myo-inositol-1(or 4)-monophosphatase